jgi:hypothetical protein
MSCRIGLWRQAARLSYWVWMLLDVYQNRGYSKVTLAEYWSWLNAWFTWAQTP